MNNSKFPSFDLVTTQSKSCQLVARPSNDILKTEPDSTNSVILRKLDPAAAYSFSIVAKDRPLSTIDMLKSTFAAAKKDIGSGVIKYASQNDGTACLVFVNTDK